MKSLPVSPPLALGLALLACAGEPPKVANPVRPVDEPRAVRIIANALRESGAVPVAKRTVQLPNGRTLDIDVGLANRLSGVAYVTEGERSALEGVAPPNPSPEALLVLRGRGPDSEARILILLEENYMSDDIVGDQREASTVAAEHRIARDVKDFIVQAESEKWP